MRDKEVDLDGPSFDDLSLWAPNVGHSADFGAEFHLVLARVAHIGGPKGYLQVLLFMYWLGLGAELGMSSNLL